MDILPLIVKNYNSLQYTLLEAQTFDPNHYGFSPLYYEILETDEKRMQSFISAFEHFNWFKDATVLEAGVGRLALTRHYLPYVKKAYLIENNPHIIEEIRSEILKNGWESKVVLIVGDAMKVEIPEDVDYLVGELMSIYCANEYQVQIFQHLRKYVKKDVGKLLPDKIINLVQVTHTRFDPPHSHYPILLSRHLPTILTTQEVVNVIDLYTVNEPEVKSIIKVKALLSGKVNSVYLRSFVQVAEGYNFTGTDSLMPPTVVKLEEEVVLKAGESYLLECYFKYGTSLDDAKFKILNFIF